MRNDRKRPPPRGFRRGRSGSCRLRLAHKAQAGSRPLRSLQLSQFSRGWRRGELRKIAEAQRLLDAANAGNGVLKTVLPEHLLLDVFELLAHLIEIVSRER